MTMRHIKPLEPLSLRGVEIDPEEGTLPTFKVVPISELLVDDAYQRDTSERSIRLLRKIVGSWSWRKFKPPIAVETSEGYEVIDGQHTAIAASTRGIENLPIMIIEADSLVLKAGSFTAHNVDRIAVSAAQLYIAQIASGDRVANIVNDVCKELGVTLLHGANSKTVWKPGDTLSISPLLQIARKGGRERLYNVLKVAKDANVVPIGAIHIKAIELVLYAEEYDVPPAVATRALIKIGPQRCLKEVQTIALAHDIAQYKALAILIYRNSKPTAGAKNAQSQPKPQPESQSQSQSQGLDFSNRRYNTAR